MARARIPPEATYALEVFKVIVSKCNRHPAYTSRCVRVRVGVYNVRGTCSTSDMRAQASSILNSSSGGTARWNTDRRTDTSRT